VLENDCEHNLQLRARKLPGLWQNFQAKDEGWGLVVVPFLEVPKKYHLDLDLVPQKTTDACLFIVCDGVVGGFFQLFMWGSKCACGQLGEDTDALMSAFPGYLYLKNLGRFLQK